MSILHAQVQQADAAGGEKKLSKNQLKKLAKNKGKVRKSCFAMLERSISEADK